MRVLLAALFATAAFAADCNAIPGLTEKIDLPGHPFKIALTSDGCRLFVAMIAQSAKEASGIAVLSRANGHLRLERTVPLKPAPIGVVLTHDGKLLLAANGEGAVLLDVHRMETGAPNPLVGSIHEEDNPRSVYVNVTGDDRFLFLSEEGARAITVVDLRTRATVGRIPVGDAPIALTFSPDERWLYTTSQSAPPDWKWPVICDPESPQAKAGKHPEGAIAVVDVAKARTDPGNSVVARIRAGCNPVRLAISPDGGRAYVTARKSNAVLAFDTAKLLDDPDHAQVASVTVGTAPVPVAASDRLVFAGNSNRFGTGPEGDQTISVIDPVDFRVIGSIPAGNFPRDLVLSRDQRTLFVANFGSSSIQAVALRF
jgi:DNA-binding beta-propeller fold protein YncE